MREWIFPKAGAIWPNYYAIIDMRRPYCKTTRYQGRVMSAFSVPECIDLFLYQKRKQKNYALFYGTFSELRELLDWFDENNRPELFSLCEYPRSTEDVWFVIFFIMFFKSEKDLVFARLCSDKFFNRASWNLDIHDTLEMVVQPD